MSDNNQNSNRNQARIQVAYRPPTRVETTDGQVKTLLDILATLSRSLTSGYADTDVNPFSSAANPSTMPDLPGEAKAAMELTCMNACAAIDRITEDAKRWQINDEETVEHATLKLVKAETQVKEESFKALCLQQRPSTYLRPVVRQIHSTLWVCVYGDIVGQGVTPAEAMASFDLVIIQGAEMDEPAPPAQIPEVPKPKTKRRKRK